MAHDEPEPKEPDGAKADPAQPSDLAQLSYWAITSVVVPALLAFASVRLLGLAKGSGALGAVSSFVRAQAVPIGIGLFVAFEATIRAFRLRLPLAHVGSPGLRLDLPPRLRKAHERSLRLVTESRALVVSHRADLDARSKPEEISSLEGALARLEEAARRSPLDEAGFTAALERAEREAKSLLAPFRKSESRRFVRSVAIALVAALLLRAFVVTSLHIPSSSMVPTLLVGDDILVSKLAYGPKMPFSGARLGPLVAPSRGEVVVFTHPEDPSQLLIKRVVALAGDIVEVKDGHPTINGWRVPFCSVGSYSFVDSNDHLRHTGDLHVEYLGEAAYLTFHDRQSRHRDTEGPFVVAPGEAFVMGDNRNQSYDSRLWNRGLGGGVPFASIDGRASVVWLGAGDSSRILARLGGDPPLAGPFGRLPEPMRSLAPAIEACVGARPPTNQTSPPPARP